MHMEDRILTEILAAHADCLNEGKSRKEDYLTMFPDHRAQLAPLLDMAEAVKDALPPVRLDGAFRESLKADLLKAANQCMESQAGQPEGPSRRWLIGAAVGSALSMIGLAYFIRARAGLEKRPAAS